MSRRSISLIVKQFRFELFVIVAVLLGIAALELVALLWLPSLNREALKCGYEPGCEPLLALATILGGLATAAPLVASAIGAFGGLLLGVAVVGREVERGTAALAWPLARSRRRWLATRFAVIGTILMLAAAAPAMLGDLLIPIVRPDLSANSAFYMFETRGLLPIGRDLAAFAVAVLAGAAFGRVLPGLLLGLVLIAFGYGAQAMVNGAWRTHDAVVMSNGYNDMDLALDSRLRDRSGEVLTWNEAYERDQSSDGSVPEGWPDSTYEQVTIGLPGARRPDIDSREAAMYGGAAILLIVASAAIVDRRRPY